VHSLVQDFPELMFVLNGGIQTFDDASQHLNESFKYSRPNVWKNKSECVDLPEIGHRMQEHRGE
jgi:tRNA-dihydrouridine synthase